MISFEKTKKRKNWFTKTKIVLKNKKGTKIIEKEWFCIKKIMTLTLFFSRRNCRPPRG